MPLWLHQTINLPSPWYGRNHAFFAAVVPFFLFFLHVTKGLTSHHGDIHERHQLTATCRPDLADALQGSQQHGGRTDGLWIRQNSETARLRDLENLPLIWCCFGYIYIYNIYMMIFYHYIILYPYINIINILGKTHHVFLLKHFAKTARSAMIFPGKYPSLKLRANAPWKACLL